MKKGKDLNRLYRELKAVNNYIQSNIRLTGKHPISQAYIDFMKAFDDLMLGYE